MTRARSVATAQTTPIRGDVAANIEQHVRLVEVAAKEQAQVLVFPELSLTGYELDLADELAFSRNDARLATLVESAGRHGMTLIVGAPVRVNGRLYIGAFILPPDRKIALYTKHFLGAFSPGASPDGTVPPAENTVFCRGDSDPPVSLGGHTAAVAVCADTSHPSHARRAAERGARTYLASMFVVPSELERETASLRSYAILHAMTVVFSNFGGPTGGLVAAGRSAIWSARGELLVQLAAIGSGVAIASESSTGWRCTGEMLDP